MKPITLRLWLPDDTPNTAALDGELTVDLLRAFLTTLNPRDRVYQLSDRELTNIADGIAERDYHATVQDIITDLKRAVADGEVTDRDGAIEWLEQTIDGHHDVIYTSCAQEIIRQSRNDSAYFDEGFYSDGDFKDGIEWSKLAYMALRADVLEAIGDLDEWFKCSDCNGDVTPDDIKTAGDNLPTCADCRGDVEGEE